MDVDICHYSDNPLRYQGQIPHSPRHVTDNPVVCHEWVEGLLDYYHLTGERYALEAAIGIGENVLRLLATPRYQGKAGGIQARESGWALRSLGALYVETGEEKWLAYADRIVDQIEEWMNKYGTWLSPYTDHTVIRVPFMIAVAVNSLMRHYKFKPQERIKKMIVHAVGDVLQHTYMEDEGVFMYKDLPSIVKLGTGNPLILEALSYAYEFTGEKRFLLAGRVLFNQILARIERERRTSEGSIRRRGYPVARHGTEDACPILLSDVLLLPHSERSGSGIVAEGSSPCALMYSCAIISDYSAEYHFRY